MSNDFETDASLLIFNGPLVISQTIICSHRINKKATHYHSVNSILSPFFGKAFLTKQCSL